MEIKYFESMQQNSAVGTRTSRGLTEEQIVEFEAKFNKAQKLPLAFREYLSIAGDYDSSGTNNEDWDELAEAANDCLKRTGNDINRPFIAFFGIDDGSQFHFIYLDESDDDPYVYTASPAHTQDGMKLIKKLKYKFSELVNENLDLRRKGLSIR